jgi:transcriptional regulator with XRE-family HTH domain
MALDRELLRRLRRDRRITLRQLADAAGVDMATIVDLEQGRNVSPSYDKVVRLAASLGVSPADLWPVPLPAVVTAAGRLPLEVEN